MQYLQTRYEHPMETVSINSVIHYKHRNMPILDTELREYIENSGYWELSRQLHIGLSFALYSSCFHR